MSDHPLKTLIEAADRSISAKDFDGLMRFYTEDATLVVKPDVYARGKDQIKRAFEAISAHFGGQLKVRQGKMEVIEGGETALVVMETWLDTPDEDGFAISTVRRATYVFRREPAGNWLCAVDNSYGTALLDS
ncbi:YybH family protein [Stenotrophomonas indicatrix]|jgi:ketosteroid isomerase-like protein|uniref:YybH family protein n=1 Tax=Stenotrophomonas indicatrix TaxID=2045451 RepID=UPI0010709001|nr:nuclear transport factor 2 family protein [Stenotrophomonas indicatrix]QBR45056.1 YybH [Stenotrophomonas indicatrix]